MDEKKRLENIRKHHLDFVDAPRVFAGPMLAVVDDREDYGEVRLVGIGFLEGRVVVVAYTEREDETIRIISLRKALSHERARFEEALGD